MGKAKTAQKWMKKEKKYQAPYHVVGGPLNGYMVMHLESANCVGDYENMWDAIKARDSFLRGENAE